jgi:hypothetical protein
MKIKRSLLIFLALLLSVAACATPSSAPGKLTGLWIPSLTTSLSGEPDRTILSYSAIITNSSSREVFVESARPVLSHGFAKLAGDADLTQTMDKALPSGGSIEVKGEITLNTSGMSKEQIQSLTPALLSLEVRQRELLPVAPLP